MRIRSSHHRFFYQRNQSGGTLPRSETQKALVCGTTGFSPEEMQQFQDAATLIPMLYTANTSKLVKYNEQASGTGHFHTKKELATLFIVPPVPYIARTCWSPNGIAFFTGTLPFKQ